MTGRYGPSVELTRLYERTSAQGTRYMLGRLGAAKIVLLPGELTEDGTATWRLLLQERPTEQAAGTEPRAAPRRRSPYPRARQSAAVGTGDPRPFDDEIPL